MCGKHGEPLQLYCAQPSCQAPICTVCKSTLGHDGHVTVELDAQAAVEAHAVAALTPNLRDSISAVKTRIANVMRDEKMTNHVRKRIHRAINERLEEVAELVVRQVCRRYRPHSPHAGFCHIEMITRHPLQASQSACNRCGFFL